MSVAPLLIRSLRYGAVLAVLVGVGGAVIGFLVAGTPGLVGGLLGAALAAVFLALTAVSILIAGRVSKGDFTSPAFLGIILGVWTLKLILFFLISLWLRGQDWIDPGAFGITAIVAVLGSLIADGVAFQRSRIPIDVKLPDENRSGG